MFDIVFSTIDIPICSRYTLTFKGENLRKSFTNFDLIIHFSFINCNSSILFEDFLKQDANL